MKALAMPGLLLALAAAAAGAGTTAYTTARVDIHAGPGVDYPVVMLLPSRYGVLIDGCLGDYSWCDVQAGSYRGWIAAAFLLAPYENGEVPVQEYGPRLGLAVVSFVLLDYWGHHYPSYRFYGDRDWWLHHPPPSHRHPPRPRREREHEHEHEYPREYQHEYQREPGGERLREHPGHAREQDGRSPARRVQEGQVIVPGPRSPSHPPSHPPSGATRQSGPTPPAGTRQGPYRDLRRELQERRQDSP